MDVIAGKWKVKIIFHLFGGTKRFSELRRLLPGVHRGTLTYELHGLQADGIIYRTQYPTIRSTGSSRTQPCYKMVIAEPLEQCRRFLGAVRTSRPTRYTGL